MLLNLMRFLPLLAVLACVPAPPAAAGPGDWECVTVYYRVLGVATRSFYNCPAGYRPVNVRAANPGDCAQCGITDRAITGYDIVCFHMYSGGYGCSTGTWIRNYNGRIGILCCR